MDFYHYYIERLKRDSGTYAAVAECQRTVLEMLHNDRIPFRFSAESAVDFLAALADIAGEGCSVGYTYTIVMSALMGYIHTMHTATCERDNAWCRKVMETVREEDCGAPLYNPGDYEAWPVDIAAADSEPDAELDDEPDLAALEKLYGVSGEVDTTAATRRHFPDWDRIDKWSNGDWIVLQTYKDKILAAAGHDFFAMGSVTDALAAAKEAMNKIPLPRQVELSVWATEVVDKLMLSLEDSLREMCAGS